MIKPTVSSIDGRVVVNNAEMATISAFFSFAAKMNFSAATSIPRSSTLNPAPSSIMMTMFFPISCKSPFTVPTTMVPFNSVPALRRWGRRISRPSLTACAAASISGTKRSPSLNFFPTSSKGATRPSLRILFTSTPFSISA